MGNDIWLPPMTLSDLHNHLSNLLPRYAMLARYTLWPGVCLCDTSWSPVITAKYIVTQTTPPVGVTQSRINTGIVTGWSKVGQHHIVLYWSTHDRQHSEPGQRPVRLSDRRHRQSVRDLLHSMERKTAGVLLSRMHTFYAVVYSLGSLKPRSHCARRGA